MDKAKQLLAKLEQAKTTAQAITLSEQIIARLKKVDCTTNALFLEAIRIQERAGAILDRMTREQRCKLPYKI